MAAPYRLVVSSISHYNSVLVDRRHHQVVHYCDGPCSLLMHGLECTAAHRTLCSELTDLPPVGSEELLTRTSMLKGAGSAHLSNCRPMNGAKDHQRLPCVVPGFRRASSLQTPFSLKDITRDTINLASGKIKEFSFNHIPLRRGRKPRLDPLRQRCADVPFTGGPFCGNEENQPPFSLLPRSHPEDLCKETHATFTELSANIAVTSRQLDVSAEENLMAQILELTKVDTGTSGEDIGSCLNILLRCSDDLKKCTDIIRQCIKRKALVEGGGNQENKVVYQTIVAQLSRHLKKLPIGLECGLPGDQEHSDQSILFNNLHGFQQSLLCPNIDLEQPPRYEDVVCSPPSIQSLYANQSHSEVQEATRIPCSSEKVVQGPHCLPFPVPPTRDEAQHYGKVRASSPSAMFDVNVSNISGEGHDESGELLYTDEEPDDHEVLDSKIQETGKCSLDVAGLGAQGSILQDSLTAHGSSFAADVLEKTVFVMDVDQPQAEELCETFQGTDRVSFPEQRGSRKTTDSMEKFLMGLEHHSHGADKEPRVRTCGQQTDNLQCSTLERDKPAEGVALQKALAKPVTPPKGQPGVLASCDEEKKENDGAVLLEILERIENFAQELADGGMTVSSGTETTTQEQEATNLQQDTVSKSIASSSGMENPSQQEVTGEEREPKKIQQTLEIAWVQSKEKPEPPAGEIAKACASTISIPCFYFPNGVPVALGSALDQTIAHIEAAFSELGEQRATIQEMGKITKACGCPLYWKAPLFHSAGGGKIGFISASSLVEIWRKLSIRCHDDSSRFIYLLAKPDCSYLEQEDFITLLQDVVNSHPGLTFLKDAPEFHSRYITTVIQRIFYTVNRSWSGRITVHELRRSNFLQTLAALEEESDINRVTDYFSYEHFYVIYCKFWELDTDHNLLIDQRDLVRYNYHASSERIVERLFSGAVSRGSTGHSRGRMTYAEFVWFLISEEDKRTPTSVEYWFRCMDLDGDGVLSMYELEHFYQEQRHRLEAMGIDPLPFHDLMCQVLDLVRPQQPGKITLQDLKRCGMAHVFYDTFFSLEKYLDHEQRDPFTVHKEVDSDGQALSDWCRFAAEEYEVLVAEESESEHLEDESSEGDVECEKPMVSLEIAGGTEELDESDLLA